jgi:hypothetical protein
MQGVLTEIFVLWDDRKLPKPDPPSPLKKGGHEIESGTENLSKHS